MLAAAKLEQPFLWISCQPIRFTIFSPQVSVEADKVVVQLGVLSLSPS